MTNNDINEKKQIQDFYQEALKIKNFSTGSLNAFVLMMIVAIVSISIGYILGAIFRFPNLNNTFSFSFFNNLRNEPKITIFSEEELQRVIGNSDAYNFNFYRQIVANLKNKYVDPSKIDDEILFESSLKGLVSGIGDPHTVYMTEKDYSLYQSSMSGNFEGIGVKLTYENKRIVVDEVFDDSPASNAGVKKGYIFLEVDGVSTENMNIEEVVSRVRGPKGSNVTILFFDPVTKTNQKKVITRDRVYIKSVEVKEKTPDTAILRVIRFSDSSTEEWKKNWDKAISELQNSKYKNIVIDLRGNGGGFLASAVHAAGDFIDPNDLILIKRSREGGDEKIKNTRVPKLKGKNIVILVNGGTASASEILAGALRYHNGYKIVGTQTYGKGTVQQTLLLPNGGALKVTVEYWLLPDGTVLDHQNPIKPDVIVNIDDALLREGKDIQMEKALELFK